MRKSINEKLAPAQPALLKQRLWLRVKEFAELTGTPTATVYSYINAGKIPCRRIGATIRIPVEAVEKLGHPAA
jgi:excisionase family DNA binding protein